MLYDQYGRPMGSTNNNWWRNATTAASGTPFAFGPDFQRALGNFPNNLVFGDIVNNPQALQAAGLQPVLNKGVPTGRFQFTPGGTQISNTARLLNPFGGGGGGGNPPRLRGDGALGLLMLGADAVNQLQDPNDPMGVNIGEAVGTVGGGVAGGIGGGALLGTLLGGPGIGTAIGALIGGSLGSGLGQKAGRSIGKLAVGGEDAIWDHRKDRAIKQIKRQNEITRAANALEYENAMKNAMVTAALNQASTPFV